MVLRVVDSGVVWPSLRDVGDENMKSILTEIKG